jgi:amidase
MSQSIIDLAAAIVGYVSQELGSDPGGSFRTPARHCGVYAHKPSLGLVPARGLERARADAR